MVGHNFQYHALTHSCGEGATSPLRSQPEVAFTLNQDNITFGRMPYPSAT
jgi:hypothetical protein